MKKNIRILMILYKKLKVQIVNLLFLKMRIVMKIVLDVAKVNAQKSELMENYNISREMSSDIK